MIPAGTEQPARDPVVQSLVDVCFRIRASDRDQVELSCSARIPRWFKAPEFSGFVTIGPRDVGVVPALDLALRIETTSPAPEGR